MKTICAGQKFLISGPFTDEQFQRCARLPQSRYKGGSYICQATPAAAWMVRDGEFDNCASELRDRFVLGMEGKLKTDKGYFFPSLKTTPWKHQPGAIWYGLGCSSPYLAMGMGTGKSLVSIGIIAGSGHKRTIILCPKSVMDVWAREFRKHSAVPFNVVLLNKGSTPQKISEARRALACDEPVVLVNNYESARQTLFTDWMLDQQWDCGLLDEAHRVKDPSGVTGKMVWKLGRRCGHKIALSGTPMPNSILDIFSQYRFLDPGVFGDSFYSFKKRYTTEGYFHEVKDYIHQDEFRQLFETLAYSVSSDVLDLPTINTSFRSFELSPAAMKAYGQLRDELATEIGSSLVTASNVLVRSTRLRQLTSGFYTDENTEKLCWLDDQAKARALEDAISDMPRQPIVVAASYTAELDQIARVAGNLGLRYGELSGRRNDLVDGCYPEGVELFGLNIKAGGVGVDLTRAAVMICYSMSWAPGDLDQLLARIHRPGQSRPCYVMHLVASGTIDEQVYSAIENKQDLIGAVLAALKR